MKRPRFIPPRPSSVAEQASLLPLGRRITVCFGLVIIILLFAVGTIGFSRFGAGIVPLWRLPHETARTTATVIAPGACSPAPRGTDVPSTAQFVVGDRIYKVPYDCLAKVGDRFTVRFDPADPEHHSTGYQDGYTAAIVLLVLSAVCFAYLVYFVVALIAVIRRLAAD